MSLFPSFRFLHTGVIAALAVGGCDAVTSIFAGEETGFNAGYVASDKVGQLEGVWASQGYGFVLDVGAEQFQLYDVVEEYCAPNEEFAGPVEALAPFRIAKDGGSVRIAPDDPAYLYTFDRVDGLPETCGAAADTSPAFVFDVFDRLFREHYAFFEERSVDWPALVDAARTSISDDMSEEELFAVLRGLVESIDDGHVSLTGEIGGEIHRARTGQGRTFSQVVELGLAEGLARDEAGALWRRAYGAEIQDEILGGNGFVTGNERIRYGTIGDDIGYLAVIVEGGYGTDDDHAAIEDILDEILPTFSGAEAVIIDLSINHGGHDGVSRQIARRFAAEQTLGYSKYAGDAAGAVAQDVLIRPNDAPSFHGPVYLLTSNHTVSAGEILVMSLRALPNVTHVGEATRGALSDILLKTLPNGWSLGMSNEVYLDHEGVLWEGRGIAPEIAIEVWDQDDPSAGHKAAVDEVVAMIRG